MNRWFALATIAQVITTVIGSAVRHGGGIITVTLVPADLAWPGARIMVDGEGEGIPEEIRRRVFTKFWTLGHGGSGLGMYIVGRSLIHISEPTRQN